MNDSRIALSRTAAIECHNGGTVVYAATRDGVRVGWVGDGREWRGHRYGARRWWAGHRENGATTACWNPGLVFRTRAEARAALADHLATHGKIPAPAETPVAWLVSWARKNYPGLESHHVADLVELVYNNRTLPTRDQWAKVIDHLDAVCPPDVQLVDGASFEQCMRSLPTESGAVR